MNNANLIIALQGKIDNLNKPKGSLGRLEDLALQIGLIQGTLSPTLNHPVHLLFGADHGIEREGVSVSPREVTWQQMVNFTKGGGGVNMFCRQHGFELKIIDMGVDHNLESYPTIIHRKVRTHGTGNFLHEPAMTTSEMQLCLETGKSLVEECHQAGCNILSIGEMGIGNTSPSSIWMHLLTGIPMTSCVGAGAGLNDVGIRHKMEILNQSLLRTKDTIHTPESIMREYGGFEMVAAVGAMIRAAELKIIVLVDGFIMTAAMLMSSHLYPPVIKNAIFCHVGSEIGHQLMLKSMNAKPLLNLGLRLGEGTGALCAFPIIDSAVRMINEMNNFDNAKITKYF